MSRNVNIIWIIMTLSRFLIPHQHNTTLRQFSKDKSEFHYLSTINISIIIKKSAKCKHYH